MSSPRKGRGRDIILVVIGVKRGGWWKKVKPELSGFKSLRGGAGLIVVEKSISRLVVMICIQY